MLTREIPREEWIDFFDDFSKLHEGWLVTLEVIGSDIGDQEEATGLPLVGISADLKDRENRIVIMVGGRPDTDLTHTISASKRVWLRHAVEPGHETLKVESEDGMSTLVHFYQIPPGRQLPEEA